MSTGSVAGEGRAVQAAILRGPREDARAPQDDAAMCADVNRRRTDALVGLVAQQCPPRVSLPLHPGYEASAVLFVARMERSGMRGRPRPLHGRSRITP